MLPSQQIKALITLPIGIMVVNNNINNLRSLFLGVGGSAGVPAIA